MLKGGTALLLAHELPRHSTDLDFDSAKKLNIEGRLRAGLAEAGVEVASMDLRKDSATVQRFMIHYHERGAAGDTTLLKVETSFRPPSPDAAVIEARGIRTYDIPTLYDQKLEALEGRTAPRDLFDVAHMTERYGDRLRADQIQRADGASRDLDGLVGRFDRAFQDDSLLTRMRSTAEDETLRLRKGVEREMGVRRERERTASREREVDDGYGL